VGSLVKVTCASGDLDVDASIGIGMLGASAALCACASCRDLVEIWRELGEPDVSDNAACPRCSRPTVVVIANDPDETARTGCPRCGGELSVTCTGMWD